MSSSFLPRSRLLAIAVHRWRQVLHLHSDCFLLGVQTDGAALDIAHLKHHHPEQKQTFEQELTGHLCTQEQGKPSTEPGFFSAETEPCSLRWEGKASSAHLGVLEGRPDRLGSGAKVECANLCGRRAGRRSSTNRSGKQKQDTKYAAALHAKAVMPHFVRRESKVKSPGSYRRGSQ